MVKAADTSDTALLVIDMQAAIVEDAYQPREVLDRVRGLLDRARVARRPVIFVQHDEPAGAPLEPGTPGWRIHEAIAPRPEELVIRKRVPDSFCGTTLDSQLRDLGVRHLVIAGMETDMCVDATSRSALGHDYNVTLASDAHTTWDGQRTPAPAQVIAHHNELLANLPHPECAIVVKPAAEITFTPAPAAGPAGAN